ncbi:hypothetical protein [Streptomyces sp. NPDC090445]|uniref:hypothetical protein n=1 Tax=Streptomyces sp. NPDC090445 TaxID=3365963 RepID=UPI00381CF430
MSRGLGAARWHRLTPENLDAVRAGLSPRALLNVWPDLDPDVAAVLAALPEEGAVEFVWEAQDGTISHAIVDDTEYQQLAALVAGARAACALPLYLDERHPLLCAVLPDSDGVLRAVLIATRLLAARITKVAIPARLDSSRACARRP